jgi:hypothetical protein
VVNAGTALWGGHMIKEMLMLRGDSVNAWYHSVNTMGPEFERLMNFNMREELYFLKVKVREANGWVQRAIIPATSPFMTDDRTLALDLSHVVGDSVTLRIEPPRTYWQIDYVGLSFGADSILTPKEIAAMAIDGEPKQDVLALFERADDRRYIMPEVGDHFEVSFPVPTQTPGTQRKLFLKSRGYYDLHLPQGRPENQATLTRLAKRGEIGKYTLQRFHEWQADEAAKLSVQSQ